RIVTADFELWGVRVERPQMAAAPRIPPLSREAPFERPPRLRWALERLQREPARRLLELAPTAVRSVRVRRKLPWACSVMEKVAAARYSIVWRSLREAGFD